MQATIYELLPTILAIALGSILTIFLFRVYLKQEVRLSSDLPLIFGITFAGLTAGMILQLSFRLEILEETLDVFRLRAIYNGILTLPMLWILLNIWASSYQHRHRHIMGFVISYWLVCTFLGPSISTIMMLLLPVMFVVGIGLILTFIITWKTKRLQEIRSGITAIGLSLMLLSQVLRAVVEFAFFVDLVMAQSMLVITVALVNPWKQKEETYGDSPYEVIYSESTIE